MFLLNWGIISSYVWIKNKNAIDFFIKIIYNITRESVINTYLL